MSDRSSHHLPRHEGLAGATRSPAECDAVVAAALVDGHDAPGALLPILHRIQDELGFVPPSSLPAIGRALNRSRAEIHGVVTFYHHFRQAPPGRHVIKICVAEACQSMGAIKLAAHAEMTLGAALHTTSTDGNFTLEPIYCLGNCACSPAMMVDGEIHGRVTPARFDAIVKQATTDTAGHDARAMMAKPGVVSP